MRGLALPSILSVFPNKFNKFNNEFIKRVGGKKIRCEAWLCRASYRLSPTSLINSIIQDHECNILFII